MKKYLCISLVFLGSFLSAQESIDHVFEEWLKYHYSGGAMGTPSKVFDQAIKLVSKRKGDEARECLKAVFPNVEIYIDQTVQLFENADEDLSNRLFSWNNVPLASFSFTDHMLDKRDRDEGRAPHIPEEIRWHLIEGIGAALGAGECIALKAPIAAVAAAVTSVHHFLEAAHKYCENVRYENEQQSCYDRSNDSEVR